MSIPSSQYDPLIQQIAKYAIEPRPLSPESETNATLNLLDSLACALLALQNKHCQQRLGPYFSSSNTDGGVQILGTQWQLPPDQAAFNLGCMIRWLDFNDYFGGEEWAHPSDNIATLWILCEHTQQESNWTVANLLEFIVKAHEIQGILAMNHGLNRYGIDHVAFVKIASTAVACAILKMDIDQCCAAISLALVDGQALRTYRHKPNTGPRKSWAAGDACARAVRLAYMAQQGEPGYPLALSTPEWGAQDVLCDGQQWELAQPLDQYIINHCSFKLPSPTEFHAQTALEAAIQLSSTLENKLDQIEKIVIETQESGFRIINKTGPLTNPAARDHCIQYIVAIGLVYGELTAEHYEETIAQNPQIDLLRAQMEVIHNKEFSNAYADPTKRAVANAVQIYFQDGSCSPRVQIDFALGQPQRRKEAVPILLNKLKLAVEDTFDPIKAERIMDTCRDFASISKLTVNTLTSMLCQEIKQTHREDLFQSLQEDV